MTDRYLHETFARPAIDRALEDREGAAVGAGLYACSPKGAGFVDRGPLS